MLVRVLAAVIAWQHELRVQIGDALDRVQVDPLPVASCSHKFPSRGVYGTS